MILIVGGVCSGKCAFARRLLDAGATPGACGGRRDGSARRFAPELDCAHLVAGSASATDGTQALVAAAREPGSLLLNAHALASALLHRDADDPSVPAAPSADAGSAAQPSGGGRHPSWRFEEADVRALAERLVAWPVVTWAEQGCGVVPVDARERCLREAAGRLGCELATRAEVVVRMTCGLPRLLKGALPAELLTPRSGGGAPCS